jgi:hypothetical protein
VFALLLAVLKKGRQYTGSVYASWSSELVLVSESVQCSSDNRIQEANRAEVIVVIVTCSSCKSPERINLVTNSSPLRVIIHTTHLVRDNMKNAGFWDVTPCGSSQRASVA